MRIMLVALVIAPTGPLLAQAAGTTTAPVASATTPAKPAKPKMVCVQEEQIGSRLGGHKTCMTAEQWRAQQSDSKTWTDNTQRQTAGRPF